MKFPEGPEDQIGEGIVVQVVGGPNQPPFRGLPHGVLQRLEEGTVRLGVPERFTAVEIETPFREEN